MKQFKEKEQNIFDFADELSQTLKRIKE